MKDSVRRGCVFVVACLWSIGVLFAENPQWWVERGVVNPGASSDDYAPLNQGQAKHMAGKTAVEFEDKFHNHPIGNQQKP